MQVFKYDWRDDDENPDWQTAVVSIPAHVKPADWFDAYCAGAIGHSGLDLEFRGLRTAAHLTAFEVDITFDRKAGTPVLEWTKVIFASSESAAADEVRSDMRVLANSYGTEVDVTIGMPRVLTNG